MDADVTSLANIGGGGGGGGVALARVSATPLSETRPICISCAYFWYVALQFKQTNYLVVFSFAKSHVVIRTRVPKEFVGLTNIFQGRYRPLSLLRYAE